MAEETLRDLTLTDLTAHLEELERARDYARASTSANTRRAYVGDWADFTTWVRAAGRQPLPASAETVALYLSSRAARHSTATLGRRLAAIRAAHRAADQPLPSGAILDRVWAGIRRTHGRPAKAKSALGIEQLREVVAQLPITTKRGLRDRGLLLLGFAAALRRSELAALELSAPEAGPTRLRFVPEGIEIELDRSKADQLGQGAIVAVPTGTVPNLCPVTAVRAWLAEADISQGRVFRSIDRWGVVHGSLSDKTVAEIVKVAVARVGLDPALFAGHSLRSGLATAAAANDAPAQVIMDHMRHARFDTTKRYIQQADRFRKNAARMAGL